MLINSLKPPRIFSSGTPSLLGRGPGGRGPRMNTLNHFATPQLELLHRGKVRDSFRAPSGERLIVVTDRLSAFDSVLETPVAHKGAVLNGLARFLVR